VLVTKKEHSVEYASSNIAIPGVELLDPEF